MQDVVNAVGSAVSQSLQGAATILPNLLASIVIFLIGVFLGVVLKNLLIKVLNLFNAESLIAPTGITFALKKADKELSTTKVLGELLKWFVILVFLVPTLDILGLQQVGNLINSLLLYLPNVLIAVIIVVVGAIFARFARDFVVAATAGTGAHAANLAGQVARWSIIIFAILAALTQLGVASDLIRILFTGAVAMIALAGGLAFGLGGKDLASNLLKKIQEDLTERH